MKKLIFLASALAGLFFAASCQQENLEPIQQGNTVTYTVQVPEVIATKAIGDEVTAVDKVYYEVYRAAEVGDLDSDPVYQGEKPVNNNSASFDLEFVKNQEFVVLFWAQSSSLVQTSENPNGMYDIDDLRQIQLVNPGAANNDAAQVFAGKDEVSNCTSAANGSVTLTRPVSQINVYTTTESLSFGDVEIGLETSSMTVSGLYNTYNVATGDAVEADENEATFAYAAAKVPTVAADNADFTYVAMNYVGFAPTVEGTNVTVDLTIKTTEAKEIKHKISNVPVKPNFRTNITGNLITATSNYNVSLNDKWSNAEITYATNAEAVQVALDAAADGAIIKLEPGVNYGTLKFRANPGHSNTTLDEIADAWRYNYNRSIKDITIIGAEGAKVDGFVFETGALPGDCNNRVTVNNLVIDGVEFTDAFTATSVGYNAPIMITTSNATIDGLTVKNCKLIGDNNKLNLVYLYGADGSKNVSLINNKVEGIARLCELRGTENVTLTGNVIKNTYEHAMLLAGGGYAGNVTITGNTADGIHDRFVRMAGAGDAVVVIAENTINNYLGEDTDYIKVTDGNNVTIENNTISVGAKDAASAQAALDNAVPGDKIQLQPGVNYGTLIFRKTASSTVVDITDAGGDAAGNEKYRRIEDLTIIGAEGAIVDGFDFEVGWISGSGASYIDIKNLTVKNVTFSGNTTPFSFEGSKGSALGIDGLNIVDCKMNDANNNNRFVFQQISGYKVLNDKTTNEYVMTAGIKNLTITGCEITGAYQVIESRAMENLAITNNTFRGIKARDMLITSDVNNHPDKTYTGNVIVTGNQSFDGEERFVRASLNNSDAVVVITGNTINNYLGADADYIKVTGGNNVTIENNTISVGAQDATSAQAALDNAVTGAKIQLQPGVHYGTLLIRPVEGQENTVTDCDYLVYRNEMLRKVEDLTIIGAPGATVDAIKVVAGYVENSGSTGYVVDIKNLVIDSVEFTDKHTNAPHSYAAPIFFDLSYINVNGLTVKNCKLIGNNDKMNFVYFYGSGNPSNSTFETAAKNVIIKDNVVDGIARLCELRQTENVTITGNTIKNTSLHGMLLTVDKGTYSGNVTITGNTADGIRDRFVRMAGAGDAVVVIAENTINNYKGADADYIKVTDGSNVTIENNVFGVSTWEQLKTAIINGDIIELDNDITVDEWIMFSEDYNIGDGTIITLDEINVTIDGKGHTLTINAIESAGNGDQLFQGASNLNISNLTLKYADGLTTGGLGLVSGVIEKVHFVGGGASAASAAIFPKNGEIKVKDCIFDTNGVAFYFDNESDNLTVTGCTFNQKDNKNVILLRGDVKFTNNIINSGRTVNIVSGSPVVTGNNFNNVRLKVYAAATATVSKNIINNLEFDGNTCSSTFTDNTLSPAAQAALDAVMVNQMLKSQTN